MNKLVVLALIMIGCNGDIDERWELDHDRIIAVRAEPPGIEPGEKSQLDVLLGYEELPAEVRSPDFAQVVTPASLADILAFDGTHWVVTAPSAQRLDQVRGELGLLADAPIPLRVGIAVAWPTPVMSPMGNGFGAIKTVWLGREGINPLLDGLTIDGVQPAMDAELVFSKVKGAKTKLFVEANDGTDFVNWLSSCGTVHDFDLSSSAYVTADDPKDRLEGQFALVLRDALGGVSWRLWPCHVE